MVEQDVIGHLMDVERLASDMMMSAQIEADRRKAEAKEKAERLYLAEYEKIITVLETTQSEAFKSCDDKREREYKEFAQYLGSLHCDKVAFASYLDSLCFGQ